MLITKLITACCKKDRKRRQTASVGAYSIAGTGWQCNYRGPRLSKGINVSHGWWTFGVWKGNDRGLCHGTTRNSCIPVLRKITKNERQHSLVGMPSEFRTDISKAIVTMGHSPILEASQEISGVLWNPKVHYCVHNSPVLIPILSQINPPLPHPIFWKIHFNITLPFIHQTSKWYISLMCPH